MTAPLEACKRPKKPEGFFSVDRGSFRCAAAGGLNSAVAHLVMARGTGRDNRTTQWSVHSIEQRTGISRPNAAKAVADLLKRGIWKRVRDGKHPIYEAAPGDQIPGGPFTTEEQMALAAIRGGKLGGQSLTRNTNRGTTPHLVVNRDHALGLSDGPLNHVGNFIVSSYSIERHGSSIN
jgi:hypothetical protein